MSHRHTAVIVFNSGGEQLAKVRIPVTDMLHCSVALFAIGLLAAMLGFAAVAGALADIADVLFVSFAVLAVLGFLSGLFGARRPVADY